MPDIREYWNNRAEQLGQAKRATTNDVWMRELEIDTLCDKIEALGLTDGAAILDAGCGDGYSSIRIAQRFERLKVHGLDYSENMISLAEAQLAEMPDLAGRVSFAVGDATRMGDDLAGRKFSVVTTMRCLINQETFEKQKLVLKQIANLLTKGGWYFGAENFLSGQKNLNEQRRAMQLEEIAILWHNLFFDEAELKTALDETGFANIEFGNFSSAYYYATRVIYSAMCKEVGEQPDYNHPIHRLAVGLPPMGNFSPIKLISAQLK